MQEARNKQRRKERGKKSREDEGEEGEEEKKRDVGELAGCPRKMAVVGGERSFSGSSTMQLLISLPVASFSLAEL